MEHLAAAADSFIYVVSTLGVTGAHASVSTELTALLARIKSVTSLSWGGWLRRRDARRSSSRSPARAPRRSSLAADPFPMIAGEFQSVIWRETRAPILRPTAEGGAGKLPDAVVACVGGGSNAIRMFHPFVGVEAGGDGAWRRGGTLRRLRRGGPACCTARARTFCRTRTGRLSRRTNPASDPSTRSPRTWGAPSKRGGDGCRRDEAAAAVRDHHPGAGDGARRVRALRKDQDVVICVSGRGDKDVVSIAEGLPQDWTGIGWDLRFEGQIEFAPLTGGH
ncbi:hypothetical protein DFJ73DRAFT_136478 [Zopfochytrium polystomum]|nr:hypothetical protein DFJ73DRAFT_136478 [Zopfochytrium polystomum]